MNLCVDAVYIEERKLPLKKWEFFSVLKKSGFKVKAGDRGQPAPVVGKRSENKNYLRYTDFVCDNAGLYVPRRDCGRQLQQWLAMRRGGECEQPCFQCELEHFRAHVSIKMDQSSNAHNLTEAEGLK